LDTQIINPQVLLAARFVRFSFMINLLRAFTPRIVGVLARDVGSCDRGDGWWVCLAPGNPAGYIPAVPLSGMGTRSFAIMEYLAAV
jgi:hypothetical protein